MKKIHFMSAAIMAILLTSMGGLQQVSAQMGTDVIPIGGAADFYELIDGSGSIPAGVFTNSVIPNLAIALKAALEQPNVFGNVRVTIIQYSTSAQVECGGSVLVNSQTDVDAIVGTGNPLAGGCLQGISQLGGGTDIAAAYDLVTTQLGISPLQSSSDRSIVDLITDGNHNSGPANPDAAFAAALAAGLDSSVVLGIAGNEIPALDVAALEKLIHPTPGPTFNPYDPNTDVLPDPLVAGSVLIIDNFDEAFVQALAAKLNIVVDIPVGGEFLSIDTAALLIAGAQTNAVWLLSALAVIGSVAFGALYINSRKQ